MPLAVVRQLAADAPDAPSRATIARWAGAALRLADRHTDGRELTVRIVGDAESRRLNRQWRGKDRPTNVLAFPTAPAPAAGPDDGYPLGDLIVCAPVVAREAAEQGKSPESHWCHMIVHGTLHLAGYDHQTPRDAARMERVETEVLAEFGYADPYLAR